jgi:hypothetical protein
MQTSALNHGRRFVASIMTGIEEIPESDGMWLMRGVTNLETGSILDTIVIRSVERLFWSECVHQVMTPGMVLRVCAVGTPGIGKTTSTIFLIRTLFEKKHTVVYRFASEPYYWEFKWWHLTGGYHVHVYPDDFPVRYLIDPSTFYIVDPGASRKNCLPNTSFAARTIIVSSSDDYECWGRSHLERRTGNVDGQFMMFPMWDLEELLMARPYLQRTVLTDQDVEERFRQVGGIPRYVFADEEDLLFTLQNQKYAIASLTAKDVERIFGGNMDAVGSFDHGRTKSEIICYAKTYKDGEIMFETHKYEFISRSMAEKVGEKFMPDLWRLMLRDDNQVGSNKLYEAYCLHLILTLAARSFRCRPCCGKRTYNNESQHETDVVLGGCKKVRLGCNILKKVIEGDSMTLFHSTNPSHDLVDFIYKDNDGTVHAFKATLGKKHTVQLHLIQKLRESLGNCRLAMYFLIPEDRIRMEKLSLILINMSSSLDRWQRKSAKSSCPICGVSCSAMITMLDRTSCTRHIVLI